MRSVVGNNLLIHLKSDYKAAEITKTANDNKVAKWMNILNSAPLGNEERFKSQYVSQLTRKLAGWQIPSIVEPFTSAEDIVDCKPATHADKLTSDQSEALLNFQFCREFDRFSFITDLVTEVVHKGTCFVKTGWVFDATTETKERPTFEAHPITGEAVHTGYEEYEEQVTKVNHPTVEIVDLLDIRIDPTCRGNLKKANFIIHDFETSLSELRADPRYENLDDLKGQLQRDHTFLQRKNVDSTFTFEDEARKRFIVHEYWGKYDLNDDGIAEPIVVAWVGETIIRQEENPFPGGELPFERAVYKRMPGYIYGTPLAEEVGNDQRIDTVLHRGIFDDLKSANNGQRGIKKGFTDDINLAKFKAGKDFEYNTSMADVWEGKYTPINNSVFNVIQATQQSAESASGVKAFEHGSGGNSLGSTAAAVNATTSSSAKREMQIIRGIAEECIIPVLRKWLAYDSMFLEAEQVIAVTDEEFQVIKRDDLAGKVDIKMSLATQESKALKADRLAFLMQTMGPNMQPDESKMIMADMLKLNDMPSLAKALMERQPPPPDPMQVQTQQLQIAMLQAQLDNERAKAAENHVDAQLKTAKARDLNASADMKDLDYVQKGSGQTQQDKLDEASAKHEQDLGKKAMDHISKMDVEQFKATHAKDMASLANRKSK
jgi:hypothetical protein